MAAEALYRQWMRRLQVFIAVRPAKAPARTSVAAVRHDIAVRA
jgi:hypothetical protein